MRAIEQKKSGNILAQVLDTDELSRFTIQALTAATINKDFIIRFNVHALIVLHPCSTNKSYLRYEINSLEIAFAH